MNSKRDRVKSTPFSDFIRYASSREKRRLFDKLVRESIQQQRSVIAAAERLEVERKK